MYQPLDTPPPRSQLYSNYSSQDSSTGRAHRRPWSPEIYDPLPSTLGSSSRGYMSRHDDGYFPAQREEVHHPTSEDYFSQIVPRASRKLRQEASEASVEALDLADYAKTLRSRQAEDPYPPFPAAATGLSSRSSQPLHSPKPTYPPSAYPPSSFPSFPRGGTLSSGKTSTTATHRTPQSVHSLLLLDPAVDVDPSLFPTTALHKSGEMLIQKKRWMLPSFHPGPEIAYELEAGFAPPKAYMNGSRSSLKNSKGLSPFDPGYIHPESYPRAYDPYDDNMSYPSYAAPSYNNHEPLMGRNSRDGVAPWSLDPPEYKSAPLDPHVKEERIRMLEHEFGSGKGKKKDRGHGDSEDHSKERIKDDGLLRDDDGKLIVGTPDGKGGLATSGPKTRGAIRWLQVALAVAVGGPNRLRRSGTEAQSSSTAFWQTSFFHPRCLGPRHILASAISIRHTPCTRRRRHASSAPFTHPGAMMIPVSGPVGKKGKPGKGPKMPGGKKGKKYPGAAMPGDVQVNLIVDPECLCPARGRHLFLRKRAKPKDRARERAKRKRNKRRTLMASLKLEEEWKAARSWLRTTSIIDTFASVLWATAFGFVIAGKRCPTGGKEAGYGGWCTAYNAVYGCCVLVERVVCGELVF
ncbi:hypothetical protein BKA70DRAFT_1562423 [Coprinopsis sp. MPI-PUGE-AT-0042]|nr:hypothetical protein BKA70DRAFT_1562423 [Coprinopsis sp. MPI-PUGE-AT-0042]